jgi:hypothetical protein
VGEYPGGGFAARRVRVKVKLTNAVDEALVTGAQHACEYRENGYLRTRGNGRPAGAAGQAGGRRRPGAGRGGVGQRSRRVP